MRHVALQDTYFVNSDGKRLEVRKGDRIVIPAGAVHAEGAVTVQVKYLVTHGGEGKLGKALTMYKPGSSRENPEELVPGGVESVSEAKNISRQARL